MRQANPNIIVMITLPLIRINLLFAAKIAKD
jgi:hypothetical protein